MSPQNSGDTPGDLPAGIARPARRAFEAAGLRSLADLSTARKSDLKKLHGVGPKAIRLVSAALKAQGMTFRAE